MKRKKLEIVNVVLAVIATMLFLSCQIWDIAWLFLLAAVIAMVNVCLINDWSKQGAV